MSDKSKQKHVHTAKCGEYYWLIGYKDALLRVRMKLSSLNCKTVGSPIMMRKVLLKAIDEMEKSPL